METLDRLVGFLQRLVDAGGVGFTGVWRAGPNQEGVVRQYVTMSPGEF